jgi:ketosteroid isomerase-like protein
VPQAPIALGARNSDSPQKVGRDPVADLVGEAGPGVNDQLHFAVMAETGNREIVEKFFQAFNAGERDRMESWLDPEYVWEMPQSGERVRGVKNNREMMENYPGPPTVETRRVTGSEDKWVTTPSYTVLKITGTGDDYTTESVVKYPDGSVWHAVDFFQFRAGKILRQIAYFAPTLEPAEWRSRWVERI